MSGRAPPGPSKEAKSISKRRPWSDDEILTVLDLHDHEGMTFLAISDIHCVSRSTIAGIVSRIKRDLDLCDPTGHLNGTMPRKWWTCRQSPVGKKMRIS